MSGRLTDKEITVDSKQPVLLFGGPYSNFHALEAMKREAQKLGLPASQIICTGDLAAYCADPEETVRACFEWGVETVMGNCEEQIALDSASCACGFEEGSTCSVLSNSWYAFANSRIPDDLRQRMGALPRKIYFAYNGFRFCVIHGGVEQINKFIFPSTPQREKHEEIVKSEADVVVGGHSGIPFVEEVGGRVWFNPGVIGMPANDGTPDGWYGIIESAGAGLRFSLHRLTYPYRKAEERLRNAGFADLYADALASGLWPSLDILPRTEKNNTGQNLKETVIDLTPSECAADQNALTL